MVAEEDTFVGEGTSAAEFSTASEDEHGFQVYTVRSPRQAGATDVRVLIPDALRPDEEPAVLYVLPVEAGRQTRYGDGLIEIQNHDLHNRFRIICVAPSFTHLPWYADHPTDPTIQQEAYLLRDVIGLVERTYPVRCGSEGRLLLGFSKSGWGAFSLALRHPTSFAAAAAWDTPIMMDRPRHGSAPIFGGQNNFACYRLTSLLAQAGRAGGPLPHLVLTGRGNFHEQHLAAHRWMNEHGVTHHHHIGSIRKHDWHSGWLAPTLELMLEATRQ